jgi:pantothenate synthetase
VTFLNTTKFGPTETYGRIPRPRTKPEKTRKKRQKWTIFGPKKTAKKHQKMTKKTRFFETEKTHYDTGVSGGEKNSKKSPKKTPKKLEKSKKVSMAIS